MIYQVIVIFFSVYDAHLPSILKWNGVCVSAWHALDVRWLRRFFKLHFFLDCCYVLFSYRLSNGYGLTHYRMMHQVRPNIFMCLGNRGRSLQRNWTTPLIFSDFSALDTHTHTCHCIFALHFTKRLFEIFVSFSYYIHTQITFVSRGEQYASDRMNRFCASRTQFALISWAKEWKTFHVVDAICVCHCVALSVNKMTAQGTRIINAKSSQCVLHCPLFRRKGRRWSGTNICTSIVEIVICSVSRFIGKFCYWFFFCFELFVAKVKHT